jgi:16S rRNA (cytosine967-C5)-methyltransferase
MTQGNEWFKENRPRLKTAKEIWNKYQIVKTQYPLDKWIAQEFKKEKKYGSQDRRWYSNFMFELIRTKQYLCHICNFENDAEVEKIFTAYLAWKDFEAGVLTHSLNAEEFLKFKKKFLNFKEIHPAAFVPKDFLASFEKRAAIQNSTWSQKFLKMQLEKSSVWIRPRHHNTDHKTLEVIQELQQNSFEVQEFHFKNSLDNENNHLNIHEKRNAFLIRGEKSVYNLNAFQNGLFEFQDFASQEIGNQCHLKPGENFWDACAGGGGKTLQLSCLSQGKGAIYASDIRTYKLEEIKRRAKNAGCHNIRTLPWNGTEVLPIFPKEIEKHGGFHGVLVDAPCSSSGVWRRNPDVKEKNTDLLKLQKIQLNILNYVKSSVKVNGKLIYSTCSWCPEENEDVVEKFLAENKNFKLKEQCLLGNEFSDTMFVARMVRV